MQELFCAAVGVCVGWCLLFVFVVFVVCVVLLQKLFLLSVMLFVCVVCRSLF